VTKDRTFRRLVATEGRNGGHCRHMIQRSCQEGTIELQPVSAKSGRERQTSAIDARLPEFRLQQRLCPRTCYSAYHHPSPIRRQLSR
jgi:hypothetical protein